MVDIVTKGNEALFRKSFCIAHGHSMECVNETVETMGRLLAGVCHQTDPNIPVHEVLEQIDIEVFQHHLLAILKEKKCDCKNES